MENLRIEFTQLRRAELVSRAVEDVSDDAIVVENEFTAISPGTELYNYIHGANPGRPIVLPKPAGYCNAGTVVKVGAAVRDLRPGDRVAGQGFHERYSVLHQSRTVFVKIPEPVSTRAASLMVLAAIAMHGMRTARIELGESVVVTGLGIIGQIAASLARIDGGFPVIGIDINPARLEQARRRGIDHVFESGDPEQLSRQIVALSCEDGADVVIEATGKPAVYPLAIRLAATGGRLVSLGSPRGTVEFDFLEQVHLREVSILGAFHPLTPLTGNRYYRWSMMRDRRLLMELMAAGRLQIEDLITHVESPADCDAVYTMLTANQPAALGVVFDWRRLSK